MLPDRLRLLDGRSEPGLVMDMGEQCAARGAQGLDQAGGPDQRVGTVLAADAERGQQGVRVLGRRVQ